MHTTDRLRGRDWIAALLAGAGLGALLLGVGARAGMRVIALAADQAPIFTLEGSVAVILLGAATGAGIAAIFLLARVLLPRRRWARVSLFWAACLALMLRGLNPVTPLNASVFLPLLGLHGALLHLYWCRIYLPHRRQMRAGA